MSCANSKYRIVIGWLNDNDITLAAKAGLIGTVDHGAFPKWASTMEYALREAQQCRDALIKMGADPKNIRLEY